MEIREKSIETFEVAAKEQDKELAPLTDELGLLETGLDSLCFAIIHHRSPGG
jgi:hypothetical protein